MHALTAFTQLRRIAKTMRTFELKPVSSTGTFAGIDNPSRVEMICNRLRMGEDTHAFTLVLARKGKDDPAYSGHCRALAQQRRAIKSQLAELAGVVGVKRLSRGKVRLMLAQAQAQTDRDDARLWLFDALAADEVEANYLQALRKARKRGQTVSLRREEYALAA